MKVDVSEKIPIKTKNMTELAEYRDNMVKNPRLRYLFFELTDLCNLRCKHCGSNCGDRPGIFMDTEMALRALDTVYEDFKGQSVMICLTGGEPLLHPDFFKIVDKINELGFAWGITSNATLIDEKMAEKLSEAGLRSISVSLDGLKESHDEFRQMPGSYEKAVQGIKNLRKFNIPIQITSVFHRDNFSELEATFENAVSLDAFSWRAINIEPIGRALENKDLLLSKDQIDTLLEFIREKRFSKDVNIDVRFGCSHYLSFDYENELRDHYFFCGSGLFVASIMVNGDIYSCLDIERRKELVQGNVKTDRFSSVWFNKFKEFRTDRTESCNECKNCSERYFCKGDSTHTWDFDNHRPMFCIKREGSYYGE